MIISHPSITMTESGLPLRGDVAVVFLKEGRQCNVRDNWLPVCRCSIIFLLSFAVMHRVYVCE